MMGRQLAGSTLGIIGYGSIGRYSLEIAKAMGMEVLVRRSPCDVSVQASSTCRWKSFWKRSDTSCASRSHALPRTLSRSGAARMRPHAFFLNLSRGICRRGGAGRGVARKPYAGAAIDVGRARDQMPTPIWRGLRMSCGTPHIGA